VFDTEMAAQGGIRGKILRVSMPFEKGRNSEGKARAMPSRKRALFGNVEDPWQVVLKVHSWAKQLGEGTVQSCAEVARMVALPGPVSRSFGRYVGSLESRRNLLCGSAREETLAFGL